MNSLSDFQYRSSLPDAAKIFKQIFQKDAEVSFDIGSRDGDDTVLISSLFGGKTIAVEADPKAAEDISAKYPNLQVIQTAVSDYNGMTKFHRLVSEYDDIRGASSIGSAKIDSSSKFYESMYDNIPQDIIEVSCSRMDSVLNNLGLGDHVIDFVKIDVEGYSGQAILGFGDKLSNVRMLHVETEVNPMHEYHINNIGIIDLMNGNGFTLVQYYTEWGNDIQDHLYVNSRFFDHMPSIAEITIRSNFMPENRNF